MKQALRRRLTYANVMATVAVFFVLGGGAYAATFLPKNSVGTKQLKRGAVTAAKIKRGSVTGPKINISTLGSVPNSDALGGQPPSAFEQSGNIMSAVVTNNGTTAKVVRGTPGVSVVERFLPGDIIMRFPRNITKCTWLAVVGQPGNETVAAGTATVRGSDKPTDIKVITWNPAGNTMTDYNYHVLVVC